MCVWPYARFFLRRSTNRKFVIVCLTVERYCQRLNLYDCRGYARSSIVRRELLLACPYITLYSFVRISGIAVAVHVCVCVCCYCCMISIIPLVARWLARFIVACCCLSPSAHHATWLLLMRFHVICFFVGFVSSRICVRVCVCVFLVDTKAAQQITRDIISQTHNTNSRARSNGIGRRTVQHFVFFTTSSRRHAHKRAYATYVFSPVVSV